MSWILVLASASFCALLFFRLRTCASGVRRHQNLRHVDLRLGQVEAGLVGVVEIGHVGVGDGDLAR